MNGRRLRVGDERQKLIEQMEASRMAERDSYTRMIGMLADDRVDWRAIACRIAQEDPRRVLDAYDDVRRWQATIKKHEDAVVSLTGEADLTDLIRSMGMAGVGKISAIKEVRARTGMGLKDAKHLVDEVEDAHYPGKLFAGLPGGQFMSLDEFFDR